MATPRSSGPAPSLNAVLSDVIDIVQDLKQARRKVPVTHELHRLLNGLHSDLQSWAASLMDYDLATGVSALSTVTSAAGRTPPNLWPGDPSDGEVRDLVVGLLDRIEDHVVAAKGKQDDEDGRQVLSTVQGGILAQKRLFSELEIGDSQ
jgi:hypothetical protein